MISGNKPIFSSSCIVLLPLLLCGCAETGPELAEVSGVVTLDGAPAPKLSLQFSPTFEKGSPAYGVTDEEGRYSLLFSTDRSGAMPGRYNVEIQTLEPEYDEAGNLAGPAPVKLPERYQAVGTLTAEVAPGENTIDFDLSSRYK